MGEPESKIDYQRFDIEHGIILYVQDQLLKKRTKNGVITVYIEGYGRYELIITE
jgi:hypothetical protein